MPYKDPEKRREYLKKWRKENPEYMKNWNKQNPEYMKNWQKENPEYHKKWEEENKKHYREYNNKWKKEKYRTDPCFKLRKVTSIMVWGALKEGKGGESMLPYVDWNSYEELKEHLESQFEDWMTWENHGKWHPTEKRWHIDHIKPQSVLLEDVTSMDDPKFRECWALENLRPLEARENMSKGNKLIDE